MNFPLKYSEEFPLTFSQFAYTEGDILLFGGVCEEWKMFSMFIKKLCVFPLSARLYSPALKECRNVVFTEVNEIWNLFWNEWFGVTVYLEFDSPEFLLYNCPASFLGAIFISKNKLLKSEITKWDNKFGKHIIEIGVGVGKTGDEYLRYLINDFSENHKDFGERAKLILQAINKRKL